MKRFNKYVLIGGAIMLTILIQPIKGTAQAGPVDPGCDPLDPTCPIDGGLSLLIAAGIGVAAKKAYHKKKKAVEL